jgi:hypothetical protein
MITSYLKGSPFIIYKIPGILGQHHTSNVFGKLRYVLGITILIFNTTIFHGQTKASCLFSLSFCGFDVAHKQDKFFKNDIE